MKHILRTVAITLPLLLVMGFSNPIFAEAPTLSKQEIYNQDLGGWIQRLMIDESGGKENIVILDSNHKYSYGCLQFQYDTFVPYAEKFGVKGEIMSCEAQKELAKDMIKSNWNNWSHWKNSVLHKTAGYPPKLPI